MKKCYLEESAVVSKEFQINTSSRDSFLEVSSQNNTLKTMLEHIVDEIRTDVFSSLFNKPSPNLIPYLKERNNLLSKVHKEREGVKEWVRVLWILSDVIKEQEESYSYAKTAYDQSKVLSAKYVYGSVCRLAIKEFENNPIDKTVFDSLVNEALGVMSETRNMINSLCNCASALYIIFINTGEYGELAEDYCLKASIFSRKHEDYWLVIQQKMTNFSDFNEVQKVSYKGLLYGLKDKCKKHYERQLLNKIRQLNKAGSGNNGKVEELLAERSMWVKNQYVCDAVMEVESLIMKNTPWIEEQITNLLLCHDNLHVLSRLLDEYSILGAKLPPHFEVCLKYLFLKKQEILS